jgi:hypothetical protein
MDITSIRRIALKARTDMEQHRVDETRLKKEYREYSNTKNIDTFFEKARYLFPKLNCGLASVHLKSEIRKSKIVNGKYGRHNHTFIIINRKIVVDITADQFGGPPVYVGKLEHPWSV